MLQTNKLTGSADDLPVKEGDKPVLIFEADKWNSNNIELDGLSSCGNPPEKNCDKTPTADFSKRERETLNKDVIAHQVERDYLDEKRKGGRLGSPTSSLA